MCRNTSVALPRRAMSIPGIYAKHVLAAWAGMFVVELLAALILSPAPPLRDLVPGPWPLFPGLVVLGLVAGYLMNYGDRSPAACWAFVPPLLFFAAVAWGDYGASAPYGGWSGIWRNEFSNSCGASECIGEFIGTCPFYAAVSYSLGALLALRTPRGTGGSARRLAGLSRKAWAIGAFAGHMSLATGFGALLAWCIAPRSATGRLGLWGLPSPVAPVVPVLGAGLLGVLASRTLPGSRVAAWTWLPALGWLLATAALGAGIRNMALEPSAAVPSGWRMFYEPGCVGWRCGWMTTTVLPAYAAVAYSMPHAWRRLKFGAR